MPHLHGQIGLLLRVLLLVGCGDGVKMNKHTSGRGGSGRLKIINIEDIHADGFKLAAVSQMLKEGKCGVIPTDTCYSFVAAIDSRSAVDTLIKCKKSGKKPLSFLCKDISMISTYTSEPRHGEKWVYKMLKTLLPGPFTFVLPTSDAVPRFVIGQRHPGHKTRKWKRREIGVRIPADDVSMIIMQDMEVPLLTGSIPEAGEDYVDVALRSLAAASSSANDDEDEENEDFAGGDVQDDQGETDDQDYHATDYFESLYDFPWSKDVDFIVVAGARGGGTADLLSTIVDLTGLGSPVIIRQGKGFLGEFASKF